MSGKYVLGEAREGMRNKFLEKTEVETRIGWAKKHYFTHRNSLFGLSFLSFFFNGGNCVLKKSSEMWSTSCKSKQQ